MQRYDNHNLTPMMALSLSASDHRLNQQIISYFSLKILRGQIILVEILGENASFFCLITCRGEKILVIQSRFSVLS